MRKLKTINIFLLIFVFSMMVIGCGKDNNDKTGEQDVTVDANQTEYIYEAEDTDLNGLSGVAYSGNFPGYTMVRGKNSSSIAANKTVLDSISGGYFVSYLNAKGLTLTFNIEAETASTGNTLYVRMGSEFGTLTIKPTNIEIKVNDTAIEYAQFYVKGSSSGIYDTKFSDAKIGDIDLVEGENKIEITILDTNDYGIKNPDGSAYGPGIDCIKIVSTSKLTWEKLFADYQDQISQD